MGEYGETNITFSRNTSKSVRRLILNKVGLRETEVLGMYLGVSLTGRSPRCKDYGYLLEKVQDKLSN